MKNPFFKNFNEFFEECLKRRRQCSQNLITPRGGNAANETCLLNTHLTFSRVSKLSESRKNQGISAALR